MKDRGREGRRGSKREREGGKERGREGGREEERGRERVLNSLRWTPQRSTGGSQVGTRADTAFGRRSLSR